MTMKKRSSTTRYVTENQKPVITTAAGMMNMSQANVYVFLTLLMTLAATRNAKVVALNLVIAIQITYPVILMAILPSIRTITRKISLVSKLFLLLLLSC